MRMTALVLLHLSGTASAAHADILDRSAEAGLLMAFEVCKRNKDIGIHNGPADISFLAVFPVGNRHKDIISTAKTVTNDYLAACRNSIKAVHICTVHVLQGMFSASGIKRVAVCKERHSAVLLDNISNGLSIIRP